jgi:hypothetical protein
MAAGFDVSGVAKELPPEKKIPLFQLLQAKDSMIFASLCSDTVSPEDCENENSPKVKR